MTTHPLAVEVHSHPVDVEVAPDMIERNRLTTFLRPILAIPHLLLVGGPIAVAASITWSAEDGRLQWGTGTGVLGAVAGVCSLIAWFAIVFGGVYPPGLRRLATFYLRWRVRAITYLTLLRDEYPPFGDAPYPAKLVLAPVSASRNRVSVAFRIFLAIPHLIVLWALGLCWMFTTIIAWGAILFTGDYPLPLYRYGVGVLRWGTRVEAYLLLLHDDYPPFSLE